ncbi:MAG: TetR/AcrR family transcriptional regulator [Kordiimonadaceae bacterium]|nr:TetR/AcrR family transcriptional regulator [Kordiimonadaceae bacterium]
MTQARSTYRHGNLKEEAISQALMLMNRSGVSHTTLSIRKIAKSLEVTHRSLYNHFTDKEAFLDAVAARAFEQLADGLKSAKDKSHFAEIYLSYACDRPQLYGLMSGRQHATMKHKPALQKAVHGVVTEAIRIFNSENPTPLGNRREIMKLHMLLHGAVTLRLAGILDVEDDQALIEDVSAMLESR